ncbi:unannotated protein [freshwater metagenome]|uniref:Unannotated protein n=1 Tax=freshwater metagenome TaxID=449393 RepID=A0A6J7M8V1_9ZZZZ|nr:hypothetical protein [Actinomycetota bacterium]
MQAEIKRANGKRNYAWIENGILKMQWEDYAVEGMDIECTFTIPESELPGIYERFTIDPSVPILEAFSIISASGRGTQLISEAANETIAVTNKHHWQH